MKSIVEMKELKAKYPCLKIGRNETVVLFSGPKTGTTLSTAADCDLYPIGSYRDDWVEDNFELLSGTVTLSNGD